MLLPPAPVSHPPRVGARSLGFPPKPLRKRAENQLDNDDFELSKRWQSSSPEYVTLALSRETQVGVQSSDQTQSPPFSFL